MALFPPSPTTATTLRLMATSTVGGSQPRGRSQSSSSSGAALTSALLVAGASVAAYGVYHFVQDDLPDSRTSSSSSPRRSASAPAKNKAESAAAAIVDGLVNLPRALVNQFPEFFQHVSQWTNINVLMPADTHGHSNGTVAASSSSSPFGTSRNDHTNSFDGRSISNQSRNDSGATRSKTGQNTSAAAGSASSETSTAKDTASVFADHNYVMVPPAGHGSDDEQYGAEFAATAVSDLAALLVDAVQEDNVDKACRILTQLCRRQQQTSSSSSKEQFAFDADQQIDASGQTFLHAVADNPGTVANQCVALLLQLGANPNVQDDTGMSPLQGAVLVEDIQTCQLLLRANASMDLADVDGDTPRSCAMESDNEELIRLFRPSVDTAAPLMPSTGSFVNIVTVNNDDEDSGSQAATAITDATGLSN